MQKKPSGHQRLFFLSYVTLNCYVITSDYSRVSSRVTRKKNIFYNKRVAIALLLFR